MAGKVDIDHLTSDEIAFSAVNATGVIKLTRPKALNAISYDMVTRIAAVLDIWEADPQIAQIVIHAEGDKAFSAGGDVRQLYDWAQQKDPRVQRFYWDEYRLNQRIKRFSKPYIALINGIVMGGGVGVSFHGSHRLVGPKVKFAMPETGIGLFPDVGGSALLANMPRTLGQYVGLLGTRLGLEDCIHTKLATHAFDDEGFEQAKTHLLAGAPVEDVVTAYALTQINPGKLDALPQDIIDAFGKDDIWTIAEYLVGMKDNEAAQLAAETLHIKSPISLAITQRAIQNATSMSFEDVMRMEYRMVQRVLQRPDFFEGIRAIIIDKDNAPQWSPSSIELINNDAVDAFFDAFEDSGNLKELHFEYTK